MPNKKRKTAASSSRARQQRRQAVPQHGHEPSAGSVASPSEGGIAAEGAIGRSVADKQGVEWPAANLVRHPPGSNGGVHRGPDKGVRRNVVRAILMGALTDAGLSIEDVVAALDAKHRKSDGQLPHRRTVELIPMAMVQHLKTGLKNIARDAALGDKDAYGPMLRLLEGAHTIFQPGKDEAPRARRRRRPSSFTRTSCRSPRRSTRRPPSRAGR
jgi:hypothetical protein